MFKTTQDRKDINRIRDGVKLLNLPNFRGVSALTRVVDSSGKVVLVDGKPVPTTPYILVQCDQLTTKQEQSIIDVIASTVTEEVAFLAEAPVRALASLRTKRNELLFKTDWRFMSDQTPTKEWIDYRQALRDLPNNTVDPENPIWPTPPTNL